MQNTCKAGIAALLLATGDVEAALSMLETSISYGQHALALLRVGRPAEAYEKALKVKDRFKGRRTKYYVLKGFASVTEVILSLLEVAVEAAQAQVRHVDSPSPPSLSKQWQSSSHFFLQSMEEATKRA